MRYNLLLGCLIFLSCNSSIKNEQSFDGVATDSSKYFEQKTLPSPEPSQSSNDSVFDYRLKAFDKIEFGTQQDYRNDYFHLLNLDFRFGGQEDYYYGLSWFRLTSMDKIQNAESVEEYIDDISSLIDKKYSHSEVVNESISESDPEFLLNCMIAVAPDSLDKSIIPRDAGNRFIHKKWSNNDVEVQIGYIVDYDINANREAIPKRISFSRMYRVFIDFSNNYLEGLIKEREKSRRAKMLKDNANKF